MTPADATALLLGRLASLPGKRCTQTALAMWLRDHALSLDTAEALVRQLVDDGVLVRRGRGHKAEVMVPSTSEASPAPPAAEPSPAPAASGPPTWLPELERYLDRVRTRGELSSWANRHLLPVRRLDEQLDLMARAGRLKVTGKAPQKRYCLDGAPLIRRPPMRFDDKGRLAG